MSLLGLNFSPHCKIGDEGALYLSDLLRKNSTLMYLYIQYCKIGPDGAVHLSDMLKENSSLLYLNIFRNEIGDGGALYLSNRLRENSSLLYLNIKGNNINNKQLEDQINEEILARTSINDYKQRSYDECRTFLQKFLGEPALTSFVSSSSTNSANVEISCSNAGNIKGEKVEKERKEEIESFKSIPSSSTTPSPTPFPTSAITSLSPSSFSSTATALASTFYSIDSSSQRILLDSSIQEFLNYCAALKKWTEKIVQSLSATLVEEECICTVEILLETWTDSVSSLKNIKVHLIKQIWEILVSIFPASDFSSIYPAFYAWNPNSAVSYPASSSSSSSVSSSSQPSLHSSHFEISLSDVIVGKYVLHSEIFRGQKSSVFRVRHVDGTVPLAMKLYKSAEMRDREWDKLGILPADPRIVVKKDFFNLSEKQVQSLSLDPSFSFACIFELGEVTLEKAYQSISNLDQYRIISWIKDAAKAVQFVHEHGLLHLDIKPSNFMLFHVDRVQCLKLIDFDSSHSIGTTFSANDLAPCTPMFCAPEVLRHNREQYVDLIATSSLDVFSFGSLAYYLLSGRLFPVDVSRYFLNQDLSNDACIEKVTDVMLHPSVKELDQVLEFAEQQGWLSHQASSMLKRALIQRVCMEELLKHPFFGVGYSETFLRELNNKAKFSEVLDTSWYIDVNEVSNLKEIGQGSFGTVFEGFYQHMHVAVKQVNRDTDLEYLLKFKEELALMSKIHHSNIVRLFGGYENPALHIVMEFCDSNLKSYLSKTGPRLTESEAFQLSVEIAQGMSFLHAESRRIIHRDLKPENILLHSEGTRVHCKISDFGLSRIIRDDNDKTLENSCGTLLYMAPEVARGEKYDLSVDVYSFGLIMWEIFHCCFAHEHKIALWKYKDLEYNSLWFRIGSNMVDISFPLTFPEDARLLIASCCDRDPKKRPLFSKVVSLLQKFSFNQEHSVLEDAECSSVVNQVEST